MNVASSQSYEHLSDTELIALILHQKELFSIIIRRYEAALTRYIRRLGVKNEWDIQDILQNSFIKMYRYLYSFDPTLLFSSWAYRIVHNETYDFFRSKKRHPEITLDESSEHVFAAIESDSISAEQQYDMQKDAHRMNSALEHIDKKYRDILLLRYGEDKNYSEISDILQIPPGSVATLLHRGKKVLKKYYNKHNIQ